AGFVPQQPGRLNEEELRDATSSSEDSLLDARLKREAVFHDSKYRSADRAAHYRVMPTQYVYAQLRDALGDLNGKRVLEYGCGAGWITYDLARLGGTVCAFDISPEAVHHAQATLSSAGLLEHCTIEVMPAERLSYADESFDMAVGFAIVHHLDVPRAFAEL